MSETILSDKSLRFAAEIIKLRRFLIHEKREFVISKQLLRCGTSIGANISEANYAQSRADFINKMQVALKEAAETEYWLKLLHITGSINEDKANELLESCLELKRMLVSSVNTAQKAQK